jgi:uncharacterized membrane protein
MAPMIVLVVVMLIARVFVPWRDAGRIGLAVMFLFTASAHFAPMKHDLAAMIPPPFTGSLWLIYLTGVLEIAGAIGLLTRTWRRAAAIGLFLLLMALFPANVYAALANVPLRGNAPTPLWLRTPMQILWMAMLWWSSIRPGERKPIPAGPGDEPASPLPEPAPPA